MIDRLSAHLVLMPLWTTVVVATLPGCGGSDNPPTFPAGGLITYPDGEPLADARIQFRTVGSEPTIVARGKTNEQGKFVLTTFSDGDGAVEGKHMAIVVPYVPDDFDGMTNAQVQRAMNPIDPRFKRFESSGLEFNVTSDPAQNQFEIKVWPPRGRR